MVTLDETLKTLKANGVASAELDSCGNLLRVVFELTAPTFPPEPEPVDNELNDPWIGAAKVLAKHKPAEES